VGGLEELQFLVLVCPLLCLQMDSSYGGSLDTERATLVGTLVEVCIFWE